MEVLPEQRVQVSPKRFRTPNVTVLRKSDERIVSSPPFICIEVLSKDDTMYYMQEKIDDYVAMGVGAIWIVDPRRRKLWTADADGTHKVESFAVLGSQIVISSAEMFAELDGLAESVG